MTKTQSTLQLARKAYKPKLPKALEGFVEVVEDGKAEPETNRELLKKLFPKTYGLPSLHLVECTESKQYPPVNVGILLSGGPAPGGHNVISGLFDGLKRCNKDSRLFGFILGPGGLVNHEYKELTAEMVDEYRNMGGFDMIGTGRTKLETTDQFEKGLEIMRKLDIKALVVVGGDDSNTNAAILAEYYQMKNAGIQVIGCPKTIDGDLKNEVIEASFGFDTACKIYSEIIGNIQRDCSSTRKYWHFIKLMGRSASHIALECALQTHPNVCIISEEVAAKNMTLKDVVSVIAEVVAERASRGLNYGTVLVPEGLIEFIPAMKKLIAELNDLLAEVGEDSSVKHSEQRNWVISRLSPENVAIFASLPESVANQLMLDRDPHGNVCVSRIETEVLLSAMVGTRLAQWKAKGRYAGKFATQHHFLGYEGRCGFPSNYDADYCYSLGRTAAELIIAGKSGYMASVQNTVAPASEWIAGGVPLSMMLNMEHRKGKEYPVIKKALVDLKGKPFKTFAAHRAQWAHDTDFIYPGPIQYFGPSELCDQPTKTLQLEKS